MSFAPRLTAAALAGSLAVAAVAFAAVPAGASQTAAVTPKITVAASATKVAAWQQFDLSGRVTPAQVGAALYLQRFQNNRWENLNGIKVTERRDGSYKLWVKLGRPGVNKLRISKPAGGGQSAAVSAAVSVTVG